MAIQYILTEKIERNIYVNEEKSASDIQILINKTFLLFSHHELLMSFVSDLKFGQALEFLPHKRSTEVLKEATYIYPSILRCKCPENCSIACSFLKLLSLSKSPEKFLK